ncbi:hypothetical protein ACT048_25045 [Ectopseudomonas khazarica]|uniref:hypothetical protein n=1 Tax=Ectopseudomonas khazarica TaxID=2502979 RepID=UPI0015C86F05
MDDNTKYITCSTHGRQQATYVCQHIVETLKDRKPRGFWSSEENPGNPRPDSWCNKCEEMVNAAGEWNDETEAEAGVSLICGACYDNAKALNRKN